MDALLRTPGDPDPPGDRPPDHDFRKLRNLEHWRSASEWGADDEGIPTALAKPGVADPLASRR